MRPGFGAAPANFTRPAIDPVWPPEAEAPAGGDAPAEGGAALSPEGAAPGAGGEPPQPASAQAAHRRQTAADRAAPVLEARNAERVKLEIDWHRMYSLLPAPSRGAPYCALLSLGA
jgi:hypothetical protein